VITCAETRGGVYADRCLMPILHVRDTWDMRVP